MHSYLKYVNKREELCGVSLILREKNIKILWKCLKKSISYGIL